ILDGYAGGRARLEAKGVSGPVARVEGEPTWEERVLAARIVARYGKARSAPRVAVEWREGDLVESYEVEPETDEARIERMRV
ncbi:MAG TPA: thiamine biosynthesis protein, partial [Anaeromyxobacteraceae bacterium]|nr:thiamine biosynthesis protein [Anaeromyxobacteraceae bacterium]